MIFMAKKAFKAESKRLLDMMINSIYTHKEIFLRELISNASDALDKLYFKSLTENLGIERKDLGIDLAVDKENRLITITDNGIGMTKDELENNLGVTVDEATSLVDRFLDDALMAHLHRVTIIHGKGTGALRKGIHQFLKSQPHVKSFRLGEFGEGDAGVTIVEL